MLKPSISAIQPDVSVIVPIYNVGRYLNQALDSVQNQTHENIEIICINDGSTDNSLEIIQAHAAEDARIRIIDKENGGYGQGCNRGLDAARGKWIAILEPDDWLLPTMFEDMLFFCKQHGDDSTIDMIKTPYWRISHPDTPQEARYECSYKHRVKPAKQPFTIDMAPHIIRHHPSIWSALYSRRFIEQNHIRFHEIPGAGWADNPWLIDTCLRARAIIYLDRSYYCYREDTPEKEIAFTKNNPLIPFQRWNDMQDIVEELDKSEEFGPVAPIIKQMQIEKAFIYLGGVQRAGMEEDEETKAIIQKTFLRMDPSLVFGDRVLTLTKQRYFAEVCGYDPGKANDAGHKVFLLSEGLYNLRNNGFGYTLGLFKKQEPTKQQI